MFSLLCKYKIGTWKQEIAVLHAFAPNSHQNGKLLSQTSCKEVCRSVEMIYNACMLPQIWEVPDMGLYCCFDEICSCTYRATQRRCCRIFP